MSEIMSKKRKKVLIILICLFIIGWIPTPKYSRDSIYYSEDCQRFGGAQHAFLFYVIREYEQCGNESMYDGKWGFGVGILPGKSHNTIPSMQMHSNLTRFYLTFGFSPKGEGYNYCHFSISYYHEAQNLSIVRDHRSKLKTSHWNIDWDLPWETELRYCNL